MGYRFLRVEHPGSFDVLNEAQRQQFLIASLGFDGGLIGPEERFVDDGSEASFAGCLDYCQIGERTARYDLWLYAVDSGRLFEHGTVNTVARVIQGYVQFTRSDDEARVLLEEALEHQRAEAPRATQNPLPRMPRQ